MQPLVTRALWRIPGRPLRSVSLVVGTLDTLHYPERTCSGGSGAISSSKSAQPQAWEDQRKEVSQPLLGPVALHLLLSDM